MLCLRLVEARESDFLVALKARPPELECVTGLSAWPQRGLRQVGLGPGPVTSLEPCCLCSACPVQCVEHADVTPGFPGFPL